MKTGVDVLRNWWRQSGWLLIVLGGISSNLRAFTFTHSAAFGLASEIRRSLGQQQRHGAKDTLSIDAINLGYRNLPRWEVSGEELRELKFYMQQWRLRTHRYLVDYLRDPDGMLSRYQGPSKILPIPPVKKTKFGWDVWSRDRTLSLPFYDYWKGILYLRGLELKSGDMLITDQNMPDGDGVFTSITKEPRLGSHIGFLAFLEVGEDVFPAVIEIHEFGLRAVPLNVFVGPDFSNYIEVFRARNPPADWARTISNVGLPFLKEPHSYNLWGNEDDARYLTCATTALHLLRRTGAPCPIRRSVVEDQGLLRANLALLGYHPDKLLMPCDFVKDSQFEFVGALDYLRVKTNMVSEMMGNHMAYLLKNYRVDASTFPQGFKMNRWGLDEMAKGSWAGRAFIRWYGFNENNLPSGPRDLMAIFKVMEPLYYKASRWQRVNCRTIVGNLGEQGEGLADDLISINDIQNDENVRRSLMQAYEEIGRWFKPVE